MLGSKKIYLEYDGEFHYKKFFPKQNLKLQKQYDRIKNKYCIENNILLYRIPYWEAKNIKRILQSIITNTEYKTSFLVESIYNVKRLSKAYFIRNMPE